LFSYPGELSVGQTRRRNYEEPELGGAAGTSRMENSVASVAKHQVRVELNSSNLQV